jgi:DNA sulfur modification protein DndC
MQAMVQNDAEKEWMLPLMNFRNNFLDVKNDRQHRDFRKMHGGLQFFNDRLVHGPYRKDYRELLLRELLAAQQAIDELKPAEVREYELITFEELEEIRRIWVTEKHEMEDTLPSIYSQVLGKAYPGKPLHERQQLSREDLKLLRETCEEAGDDEGVLFQSLQEMLSIEQRYRTMARRSGLYVDLNKSLEKSAFMTENDAEEFAKRRFQTLEAISTEQ